MTQPRVYLSYTPENQLYAERLHEGLEPLLGRGSVWIDTRSGSADRVTAMAAADVVVVLVGAPGTTQVYRPAESQLQEIHTALDQGKGVLYVLAGADGAAEHPFEPSQTTLLREDPWFDDVGVISDLIIQRGHPPVNMLPQASDLFIDRTDEMRLILSALESGEDNRPAMVVITGPPGSGKTALALAAARRASARFPDGLLYASFGSGLSPEAAFESFLAAMGALPALGGRSDPNAQYRTLIADKRVLVTLDEVESLGSIQRLVNLGSRAAVIMTSGRPLRRLPPHISTVTLGRLPTEAALELLRATAGPEIVDADLSNAERLIRAVNGLPLPLRLAAGQARRRKLASLALLVAEMGRVSQHDAVSQLLLSQAYETLPEGARRLFRLLAVLPTAHFEVALAIALAEVDGAAVVAQLESLAAVALVDTSGPGQYAVSDVTFRFAATRLEAEEPEDERRAALDRAIRWMAVRTAFQPEMPITRDYWTADDTLGYAPYADAIAAFVRHRGTRPPLTIGVTAPWGAGKTSLMRMVQERLDPRADRDRWTPVPFSLTTGARKALAPGGDASRRLTNRELLRRTTEPPIEADGRNLDVESPSGGWRPTVWFNPWMYQSGEQIWAGLAYEIITQVTGRLTTADRERFWLALNLRRVDRQALRRRIYRQLVDRFLPWLLWLGLAVVLATAGVLMAVVFPPIAGALRISAAGLLSAAGLTFGIGAVVAAWKFLGAKAAGSFGPLLRVPDPIKSAADRAGDEVKGAYTELFPDPAYDRRLGFLHLVQTDMRRVLDLIATHQRPLVVFVDDLDRCSPGAVVRVIEAINLFLAGEFPNCVFVVAMEPAVVAAHVESVYKDLAAHPEVSRSTAEGATLGWRFLEKIVQLPLNLPPPDPVRQTSGYLNALLDRPVRRVTPAPVADVSPPPAAAPARAAEPAADAPAARPETAAPATADRAVLVSRLEAAIRQREPTTDTLAAVALHAQREVIPDSPATVLPETSEAANRVLVELYSDNEARTAILAGVPGLASDNPREIKRFVNLFRFYSFIAQQHRLQGLPPASGAEIAKLCVLAIRWPNLLGLLGRGCGDGASSNLGHLEQSLRSDEPISVNAWRNALRRVGLLAENQPAGTNPAWAEELRRFLETEPGIAGLADRML
ncbi:P-loop NTPase fold protein [Actinoplanes aureus]|uniref:AAA family ATPase n=1 Tax=Actinoplanes aureus TaxID=2792083 RepID=A0A931CG67_9ACTN|nr:P-loop NTPase fold protein [Actinoplanes aureus]MBG0565916.1 AAA family ATPase [Actinoplanes aureus]